jgi:gliding motility-associated protein GldM
MALPKEPRQKMINIMYLVLTALLALNVSAEILNAFRTVDNSLIGTNKAINNSTETILRSLNDKRGEAETKVKADIWYPKAVEAQRLSLELTNYIEQLRQRILKEAGFDPAKNKDSSFKADNLDITTRIMVEQKEGEKLKAKLEEYRKKLLAIDPLIAAEFKNSLQINTEDPITMDKTKKSWAAGYFHMVPTVAGMTILSKFANDVKTSENRVVEFCHNQVGKVVVRYDAFAAIVGQSSNYIMPGQDIEISAGVGAFSRAAAPTITINGQNAPLGAEGQATLKVNGGALGKHSVPVLIRFKDQDGIFQTVTKNVEYTVGQANASIALDKMNVLYIGVPNPITVAASGGGDDRVAVALNGSGRIDKTGPGKYNVFVTGGDQATITVSVEGKVAGASQFRVRRIPTPTATIAGKMSGENMNAGELRAQAGVGAFIRDFPFDILYTVTSYTISTDSDDGDIIEANVTGNAWGGSGQARAVIQAASKAGKTLYVDNIRAVGPDGRNFKLPSILYYIK